MYLQCHDLAVSLPGTAALSSEACNLPWAALFRHNDFPIVQCCSTKTGSQQALCHCSYIYGDLPSHRCAVLQHQCPAALVRHNEFPIVQSCSANKAHSMLVAVHVSARTPREIRSSYMCAVLQHQCTAALVRPKCILTAQCCSAKQAHNMHCVLAVTPVKTLTYQVAHT